MRCLPNELQQHVNKSVKQLQIPLELGLFVDVDSCDTDIGEFIFDCCDVCFWCLCFNSSLIGLSLLFISRIKIGFANDSDFCVFLLICRNKSLNIISFPYSTNFDSSISNIALANR